MSAPYLIIPNFDPVGIQQTLVRDIQSTVSIALLQDHIHKGMSGGVKGNTNKICVHCLVPLFTDQFCVLGILLSVSLFQYILAYKKGRKHITVPILIPHFEFTSLPYYFFQFQKL